MIWLAANTDTISAAAWEAWAAVATVVIILGGVGVRIVTKFSALVTSVESLNVNMSRVADSVGNHEHRISMLEGVERVRDHQESIR